MASRLHGGTGRELLRLLVIAALVVGLIGAAGVGTWRVVDEIRDPAAACTRRLPMFQGVQITSAERAWTPPIVRCEYVAAAIDLVGPRPRVSAVTAKNLVVVGALDLLAVLVVLARRGVRRRRAVARS